MTFDRNEMIDKLKLELEVLEKGGYAPSPRAPHWEPRIFRDSVSCPNLGLEIKVEPCSHCFLMQFVPPEHGDKENPCHYIPLNDRGDTVASLSQYSDSDALHEALATWLRQTIADLTNQAETAHLLTCGGGDGQTLSLDRRH